MIIAFLHRKMNTCRKAAEKQWLKENNNAGSIISNFIYYFYLRAFELHPLIIIGWGCSFLNIGYKEGVRGK